MSVEMACSCDDLPSHSHVYRHEPVFNTQGRTVGMNIRPDEFDVRIWVDWKAVAKELASPSAHIPAWMHVTRRTF